MEQLPPFFEILLYFNIKRPSTQAFPREIRDDFVQCRKNFRKFMQTDFGKKAFRGRNGKRRNRGFYGTKGEIVLPPSGRERRWERERRVRRRGRHDRRTPAGAHRGEGGTPGARHCHRAHPARVPRQRGGVSVGGSGFTPTTCALGWKGWRIFPTGRFSRSFPRRNRPSSKGMPGRRAGRAFGTRCGSFPRWAA